ncbi:hydantoinase B/oxoprolinase family protein [Elioraea tepida]|uniref:Hydantoinase B/oxoprolinase family protein n=1 Tax=Elioraea tepida TaxID=2843330 RepID=A0A975U5Y2_9PROT|nr:hydantoinase B/oxoprolinase family protein [Elioraea tepida]QXM26043.1 hydantoinase B/oxoprolinase family protein [Elioraea tepida]
MLIITPPQSFSKPLPVRARPDARLILREALGRPQDPCKRKEVCSGLPRPAHATTSRAMTDRHIPGPSDPIAFELFRNAIVALADEMALTIYRARLLRCAQEHHGLLDRPLRRAGPPSSRKGCRCLGISASIPVALRAALDHFGSDIAPGTCLILNDPFSGGMHLPDIFVFRPLFHAGRIVAIAATICHHTDVGGRVAGSNASDSTEIFQEGLRIPPLKPATNAACRTRPCSP